MGDNTTVYFNGEIMEKDAVAISPEDRGFMFGDGVYEVVRVYNGKPFEIDAHIKRLDRSLKEIDIDFPGTWRLKEVAHELIERNGLSGADATCYIQITRGVAKRVHTFPDKDTPLTVYASVSPFAFDPRKLENGVKAVIRPDMRWGRCDIKSISLLPNILAAEEAAREGAEEMIFVRNGTVTEGSHTNFCAVFDNVLHTHPEGPHILSSITREVVLRLCDNLGIETRLYPVLESKLTNADEMLILGTTKEVTPVVNLDGTPVNGGVPGPVTRKLQQAFRQLTSGL